MTIAEMVAASRRAQGLPPKIEDAGTIARVAAILRTNHKVDGSASPAGAEAARGPGSGTTPGPAPSRRRKAAA